MQAPRAWLECFTSHLLTLDFVFSQVDSSPLALQTNSDLIYLLLYVDDIIVIGTNDTYIAYLICQLRSHFGMTDLWSLKYFFGFEITRSRTEIHVSQTKYAHNVLIRLGWLLQSLVGLLLL